MIARDWILDVLSRLELWYWPVFLWQLYWLDRYLTARRAEHSSGLIGYSVCRKGRIYITLQAFGDKADPNDWTKFAPRAPWQKLAPGRDVERLQLAIPEPSALHKKSDPNLLSATLDGRTPVSRLAQKPP